MSIKPQLAVWASLRNEFNTTCANTDGIANYASHVTQRDEETLWGQIPGVTMDYLDEKPQQVPTDSQTEPVRIFKLSLYLQIEHGRNLLRQRCNI